MRIRVSKLTLAGFFRQLAAAERMAIGLGPIVSIFGQDNSLSRRMRATLNALADRLSEGMALPLALATPAQLVPAEALALLQVALEHEQLSLALETLADDFEIRERGERMMKLAALWPLTLLSTLAAVFIITSIFVIPAFQQIYHGFNTRPPALTAILFVLSDTVLWWGWIVLLVAIAVFYLSWSERWPRQWHARVIGLGLYLPSAMRFFSCRLSTRLVTLLHAFRDQPATRNAMLSFVGATTSSHRLRSATASVEMALREGRSLSDALSTTPSLSQRLALYAKICEMMNDFDGPLANLLAMTRIDETVALAKFERSLFLLLYIVSAALIGFFVISMYATVSSIGAVI